MPSAEAFAVLGMISSIVLMVDGTEQVYDAATNAESLPDAFLTIACRLPIIRDSLFSARQRIEEGEADEDSCKGVRPVAEACEKKAQRLVTLFQKTIPIDGASDLEKYYGAVKAYGKGNEVENLMKEMLEDVQHLAGERGINSATKAQQIQIIQAVADVLAVLPSVPEHVFQETSFTNTKYGARSQYIGLDEEGELYDQDSAQEYKAADSTIHLGTDLIFHSADKNFCSYKCFCSMLVA